MTITHAAVTLHVDGGDETTLAWLREHLRVEVAVCGDTGADDGADWKTGLDETHAAVVPAGDADTLVGPDTDGVPDAGADADTGADFDADADSAADTGRREAMTPVPHVTFVVETGLLDDVAVGDDGLPGVAGRGPEGCPCGGAASPADDTAAAAGGDATATASVPVRTAVVALGSTSHDAETLFRAAIVALDGIPGNQVEGISPLYHVSNFDGPDMMAAVMQLTTRLDARPLAGTLGSVMSSLDGDLDLTLVDMKGVTEDAPDCRVPWPDARTRAAVLAPWMDMDPDARLGRDPVSFLLAMAPDAGQVGLLSADWILGGVR